jgi:D-alanyl-D-alanine dipeptidase
MGSSFDLFDPISNTDDPSISLSHQKNRYLLKELMEGEGFIAYDMEWWHFTYSQSGESELYYDFVIR